MAPLQFIVTNKVEYDDLMQTIERERPEVRWVGSEELPTAPNGSYWVYPTTIEIEDDKIGFSLICSDKSWQIGQSLLTESEPLPLSALETLCAIPENEDGSITIPSELAVRLVIELKGS